MGFDLRDHARYTANTDRGCQSQLVPGPERARVTAGLKEPTEGDKSDVMNWLIQGSDQPDACATLYDCWQRGLKHKGNNFLGDRRGNAEGDNGFKWKTYGDCEAIVNKIATFLVKDLGQAQNDKTLIGMFAGNSWEWTLCGTAITCNSQVMVPLYDTLGDEAMRYITGLCEFEVMFVDNEKRYTTFVRDVQQHADGHKVKHVVVFGKLSDEAKELGKECTFKRHDFKELCDGVKDLVEHTVPKAEDTFVINFTSGTTGNPKGVILTHANWVSDMYSACTIIESPIRPDDVWLSYLPAAHVFERVLQTVMMACGGSIGFFGGDPRNLVADAGALAPTIFGAVPRVWNKIYGKLQAAQNESFLKNKLIGFCLSKKIAQVKKGINTNTTIYDKIVFKKIQALLGGRVRLAVSGAAPIKNEVLNTIRAALGCSIQEGYGQTETAAASSLTMTGDANPSVGAPVPCVSIRLDSVPEMNYLCEDDKGEICMKGYNVMKGYFKNAEKTAETIDDQGWLHTGDIGQWNKDGTLSIIDRKKHIFKLSQGEYIAPEKIENIYITHPAVAQCFVHGNSLRSKLVGMVFPDPDGGFASWAGRSGFSGKSFEELCGDPAVTKKLLTEMRELAGPKGAGLKGFEQLSAIKCCKDLMSVESGLLTPTMKAKRVQIKQAFIGDLEQLYTTVDD